MATLAEIRQKYPQYNDLPDEELAQSLHQKYYADMPYGEFRQSIGMGNGASAGWGGGATGSWEDPKLYGLSNLEKYRLGGKVGFGEMKLGIDQLRGKATPADVDAYRAQNAGVLEDPTVRSGNTSAYILGSLPMMAVPGANTVVGSGLLGAAFGGIQPVGSNDSRVDNAIRGAATSAGVTGALKLGGRILTPVKNANTPEEQAAVETLRSAGVRQSVGQQTGSKAVQATERMLQNNPYTGPAMSAQAQRQAESFTRAALRTIGEDASAATPEVLGRAKTRIGGEMERIYSKYKIVLRPQDMQGIQSLEQSARRQLGDGNPIATIAADIRDHMAQNGGRIDGKFYQMIRRDLQALQARPDTSALAGDFLDGMDNAFHAAAGKADSVALSTARGQYRNLMTIAEAADTTNRGLISPATLAQRMKTGKYTRSEFRFRGEEDLSKLARAASTVKDRFPDSGTAARVGAQLVAPSVVGGFDYLQNKDPERALQLAAATYGLPKAAAFALNNPATANYLARGIPMPPATNKLLDYLTRIAPPVATSLVVRP